MMHAFVEKIFQDRKRFFILLLGLTLFLRLSSLYYTFIDVDESQFAGFAHVLMDGGLPYQDSLDTKPPLIYLFYWLCLSVFGEYNMAGVHLVGILWSFATAWVIYRIAAENSQPRSGLWAAILYTVFSTTYVPKFIALSITSVMVLPLTLSVLFWLRGEKAQGKDRLQSFFLAGILTSLGFLLKYQGGIQIAVFFGMLVFHYWRRELTLKESAQAYAIHLLGFILPILFLLAALYKINVLSDFITWSFSGSAHYIKAGQETIPFWRNLAFRGGTFMASTLLLWTLTAVFISRLKKAVRETPTSSSLYLITVLWFFLSLIPVGTGGRFYGHYFIQLLPPLCLLAAFALNRVQSQRLWDLISLGLIAPALFFWILRVDQRTIYKYFPDDQLFEQQAVGEWIRENTHPQETLFVWGFATAIYFHAERDAVSRFLWTDLLTGKVPGSELSNDPSFDTSRYIRPEAWDAFWEDMEANPPTYFVDTAPCNIHNYGKYPIQQYPRLSHWIEDHYELWTLREGCPIYRKKT